MKTLKFVIFVTLLTLILACSVQAEYSSLKEAAGRAMGKESLTVIPQFKLACELEVAVEVNEISTRGTTLSSTQLKNWLLNEAGGSISDFGMPRNIWAADKSDCPAKGQCLLVLSVVAATGTNTASSSNRNGSSADYNDSAQADYSTRSSEYSSSSHGSYIITVSGSLKTSTDGRSYNRTVGRFEEPITLTSEELTRIQNYNASSTRVRGAYWPHNGTFVQEGSNSSSMSKNRNVTEVTHQANMVRDAGGKIAAGVIKAVLKWKQLTEPESVSYPR